MKTTLDITSIQQINLFSKITGVRAQNCFNYSNSILFVVDPNFFSRALGQSGENLRRLSMFLKKKVRIIRTPDSNDMERFVQAIVFPIKFKKLTVDEAGNVVINAGQQSKASLIGRDHARLNELTSIVKQYFNIKDIRIV